MKRLAAMGALRLSMYLKEEGTTAYWTRFPRLLDSEITREMLEEIEENYFDGFPESGSFGKLYDLLRPVEDDAGRLAWCALELAVLCYMNDQIREVFSVIYPPAKDGVTMALAAKLLYGEAAVLDMYGTVEEAFSRCELLLQAEYPVKQMGNAILSADDRLIQWLSDETKLLQHPFIRESILPEGRAANIWDDVRRGYVAELQGSAAAETVAGIISGGENSGRKFLVQQTAAELGKRLLLVDMSFFGTVDELLERWRRLLREILLQPVLLCITGVTKQPSVETMLTVLVNEYEKTAEYAWKAGLQDAPGERPLFFTAAADIKLIPMLRQKVVQKQLPMPNLAERAAIWAYFAEKYKISLPVQELAVKMKLPLGSVEKIAKRIAALPQDEPVKNSTIFRYCYELLDDGRYDNIKRVETKYTFDDLKLEESQKDIIRDICAQVECRKQVLHDWNLQSRYAYGTSISAIFTGPPGTGKTMAVHVMAGILGLELFKVDLSQIVDKYIGETEKRLEEVFRKAEQSNMILFFDEADAIIGKRSETKDAKDKYANTEVAFLLQRMEEYDGIVILATNYSQNIDAAFMRRIRFTVHFPLPDAARRKEIWQSAFAAETPVGSLDYEYLSQQFEFSGGQIKNVVWNACFFAAKENSSVEMCHLVRAVHMELTKDKKVSFQEALGVYAHLMY